MRIDYCVMDPTGNITILVETPVPISDQPRIAGKLMKREPDAEQVGFVTFDDTYDLALRMAGGEFCGNASLCAAVYAAGRNTGMTGSDAEPGNDTAADSPKSRISIDSLPDKYSPRRFFIRVSGAPGPVGSKVKQMPDGSWQGTVDMPYPVRIENVMMPEAGLLPVVCFDGISHVIIEDRISHSETGNDRTGKGLLFSDKENFRFAAERYARTWCSFLRADALGLMFLDRKEAYLTPLVYVPAADTLCWEKSCASGTTACGVLLAHEAGRSFTGTFRQPGGILTVEVGEGTCRLKGNVRLLRCGHTDV